MAVDLLDEVRRTCAAHHFVPRRSHVVVGVSGGIDSVVLLDLLYRLQPARHLRITVAHLDHGLREEASADAACVRELAAARRLPVVIERQDVRALCAQSGWSLEDGARRIRYEFLRRTAEARGASQVALAHTSDDQAETVLMRVLTGTGLLGLGGIRITRPLTETIRIIRPLLTVSRAEIVAYQRAAKLAYREDASNQDLHFLRNRVRRELLPQLEREYNPRVKAALLQLAEQSQAEYAVLEGAAARVWKRVSRRHRGGGVTLTMSRFLAQPAAIQRQLLRRAIHEVRGEVGRIEFRHWLEVQRLLEDRPTGTIVDLPGGVQLCRERDQVLCRRTPAA